MMLCTNGEYVPNIKKCLVSKKDLIFTDEMLNMLLLTDEEKDGILKNNIWQADIGRTEEFEYKE